MLQGRILLAALASLTAMATLPGCPENPYSADTWIEQLDDPKEMERAVTELEHLCDPKAIPALGKAWEKNNQPTRILQVIIDLSRPLSATDQTQKCGDEPTEKGFCSEKCPEKPADKGFCADAANKGKSVNAGKVIPGEAEEKFCTDFVAKGREAAWDKSLPFLKKAIDDLDTNSQRSIDGAVKAAEAIGSAQLPEGIQTLIDAVNTKMTAKDPGQRVRLTAITALGKYKDKSATVTLAGVIRADPTSQPPQLIGAAINALGAMRSADSLPVLIESMYRVPVFFQQTQRALIASGAEVRAEMRRILNHEHTAVTELFKEKKLDKWCGTDGKKPTTECINVSAMDYYAAMVIGGLYDQEAVPDLIKALERPVMPGYFDPQGNPGPPAHNAILDALRKIGSPDSAQAVLNILANPGTKAKPADMQMRVLAAGVYGFVSLDGGETYGKSTGMQILVALAKKDDEVEGLRLACAESLGRMVTDWKQAEPLRILAAKYAKASQDKRIAADGKPKKDLDAAQIKYDALQKTLTEADKALKKATAEKGDIGLVDPAITKARGDAQKAYDEFNEKTYQPAKETFNDLDVSSGFMKNFERGFEAHLARIEIGVRCAGKPDCLMAAFVAKPEDVFLKVKAEVSKEAVDVKIADGKVTKFVVMGETKDWNDGDKFDLQTAQIERAVLDMRRLGQAASGQVSALLDKIGGCADGKCKDFLEDRLIRQSVLLALPRIAKLPCKECQTKLEMVVKQGQGKAELNQLNYETELVVSYFTWAK